MMKFMYQLVLLLGVLVIPSCSSGGSKNESLTLTQSEMDELMSDLNESRRITLDPGQVNEPEYDWINDLHEPIGYDAAVKYREYSNKLPLKDLVITMGQVVMTDKPYRFNKSHIDNYSRSTYYMEVDYAFVDDSMKVRVATLPINPDYLVTKRSKGVKVPSLYMVYSIWRSDVISRDNDTRYLWLLGSLREYHGAFRFATGGLESNIPQFGGDGIPLEFLIHLKGAILALPEGCEVGDYATIDFPDYLDPAEPYKLH